MIKKLALAGLAFSLLALGSYAQDTPKGDVGIGYSYLHVNAQNGGPSANLNGFNASAAFNATSVIGIVGDIGVYHGSPAGVGFTATSYLFGPRFSFRSNDKFVPFVEALFGGVHASISNGGGSSNNFGFGFGGGVDVGIAKDGMIALRPEFDYIGVRNSGTTTNTERISIGLVFNFGKK